VRLGGASEQGDRGDGAEQREGGRNDGTFHQVVLLSKVSGIDEQTAMRAEKACASMLCF
jgi:hypothetical protein